jgi:hypothetical protein
MHRTTRELLDIASNHADGEEVIATTLNNPQGKGKQVVDHNEGTSSGFKKKKKKSDKHCCDDNLVAAVECKVSRSKGNPAKPAPSKDHFEKFLDAPCPHHKVPVKHSLKDCQLIKNYVNGTLKPRTMDPPKKGGPPPDNDDGARAMYPGEDCKTPDFHRKPESLYHRDSPWISGYRVQNVSQIDTQSHTSHHIKLIVN